MEDRNQDLTKRSLIHAELGLLYSDLAFKDIELDRAFRSAKEHELEPTEKKEFYVQAGMLSLAFDAGMMKCRLMAGVSNNRELSVAMYGPEEPFNLVDQIENLEKAFSSLRGEIEALCGPEIVASRNVRAGEPQSPSDLQEGIRAHVESQPGFKPTGGDQGGPSRSLGNPM